MGIPLRHKKAPPEGRAGKPLTDLDKLTTYVVSDVLVGATSGQIVADSFAGEVMLKALGCFGACFLNIGLNQELRSLVGQGWVNLEMLSPPV